MKGDPVEAMRANQMKGRKKSPQEKKQTKVHTIK